MIDWDNSKCIIDEFIKAQYLLKNCKKENENIYLALYDTYESEIRRRLDIVIDFFNKMISKDKDNSDIWLYIVNLIKVIKIYRTYDKSIIRSVLMLYDCRIRNNNNANKELDDYKKPIVDKDEITIKISDLENLYRHIESSNIEYGVHYIKNHIKDGKIHKEATTNI